MSISDLDELILRCRDAQARDRLTEAVASYKAGAYRASIVACWIAVCFDLIEKFRELELAGDANAHALMRKLEEIRRTNNLSGALSFEREILHEAATKFDLLSPMALIDLERIQDDRNRCAHPSLLSDDAHYRPPAELARLHLFNAVEHVIQHPPVQGKLAFDRVMSEIRSDYFPAETEPAKQVLESGPLRRPKDNLVKSVLAVTIKEFLGGLPPGIENRRLAAIKAVCDLHRETYLRFVGEKLTPLVLTAGDDELPEALDAVSKLPFAWENIEPGVQRKLITCIENFPSDRFAELEWIYDFAPYRAAIELRISRATRVDLRHFFLTPRPLVVDRIIAQYNASTSFDRANEWAPDVARIIPFCSEAQIERIIEIAAQNAEIRGSFKLGLVVQAIRANSVVPVARTDARLVAVGLDEYVPDALMDDDGAVPI